jgi:hypothetical protein
MSSTLVPAESASTTKLSGQASTISSVWVPIDPVEPKSESRFWKLLPSKDLDSVFSKEALELTGAEGSIHPSPVPWEPETNCKRTVEAEVVRVAEIPVVGAKAAAEPTIRETDSSVNRIVATNEKEANNAM